MFETHKLNDKGFAEVATFKGGMNAGIKRALAMMPDGRDKSIFVTKIEEAVFFGTRALASKDGNFTEIVRFDDVTN